MTVPTGASAAVAVVTETDSARAQSEESASPRKPNVVTASRSVKDESLDVWCFNADDGPEMARIFGNAGSPMVSIGNGERIIMLCLSGR